MKILIKDTKNLDKLKKQIKVAGYKKLHILSDFDRTLTYGAVNGVKTPSIISMLRDGNHLVKGYAEKAHTLFNKYHPIEISSDISRPEKKNAMQEWWEKHSALLIQSSLSKNDLEDIVKNGHVKFRDGVPEFLDFLYEHKIPLVILSSSGCGDAVKFFFKHINKDYPNIHYVTNTFNWDKKGRAISVNGPIITCANKDETILSDFPDIYKHVKDRKNVILLGDGIDDLGMIEGFDYDNLVRIGFLNCNYNQSRKEYLDNFDIVLEGDGDFKYVTEFVKNLDKSKR